jgi:tRNA dimethylallyltransferase
LSSVSSTRTKVLVLVGPTASGKTQFLETSFPAAGIRAVVVSADSMQAYRGMDIGTAKPSRELLERLPHRLIDFRDPAEQYSAGDFVRLADAACAEISAAGALPVVSGGTGFYVRNFICGLPAAPAAEPSLREEVTRDLAERGAEPLREELAAVDPESAARIHPRDLYRLTRAVEVLRATGRPLSDFAASTSPRDFYDFLVLGIERPREDIYRRIDERVEAMFAAGLPEEVGRLRAAGLGPDAPGMKAIGYREFFVSGAPVAGAGLEEVKELVKLNSKRYAKRQMTYFRALPGIRWIPPEPAALIPLVEAFLGPRPGRAAGGIVLPGPSGYSPAQ